MRAGPGSTPESGMTAGAVEDSASAGVGGGIHRARPRPPSASLNERGKPDLEPLDEEILEPKGAVR